MKNKSIRNLYYFCSYLLCVCAGASAAALISMQVFWGFLLVCAAGLIFSSSSGLAVKIRLRNIFGLVMMIGLPLFFWKFDPSQQALPSLIGLFLLILTMSCFIVENPFTLGLIHFESLFIVIFSSCLPYVVHPRYQVIIFCTALFLIVLLLQITHMKLGDEKERSHELITNVSITKRFILSFLICLGIIFIGTGVFFIAPKYSFELDIDRKGSSTVDFRLEPKSGLRLMLPYKGGEKEIGEAQVVPYVRSLFMPKSQDQEQMYFDDNEWKQPLVMKRTDPEQKTDLIKINNDKEGLLSQGKSAVKDDSAWPGSVQSDDRNLRNVLQKRIKDISDLISQQKKMFDLFKFLGSDDPAKADKAEAIAQKIKKDEAALAKLKQALEEIGSEDKAAGPAKQDGKGNKGFADWLTKASGSGKQSQSKNSSGGGKEKTDREKEPGSGAGEESLDAGAGQDDQCRGDGEDRQSEDGYGLGESSAGQGKQGFGQGTGDSKSDHGQGDPGKGTGETGAEEKGEKGKDQTVNKADISQAGTQGAEQQGQEQSAGTTDASEAGEQADKEKGREMDYSAQDSGSRSEGNFDHDPGDRPDNFRSSSDPDLENADNDQNKQEPDKARDTSRDGSERPEKDAADDQNQEQGDARSAQESGAGEGQGQGKGSETISKENNKAASSGNNTAEGAGSNSQTAGTSDKSDGSKDSGKTPKGAKDQSSGGTGTEQGKSDERSKGTKGSGGKDDDGGGGSSEKSEDSPEKDKKSSGAKGGTGEQKPQQSPKASFSSTIVTYIFRFKDRIYEPFRQLPWQDQYQAIEKERTTRAEEKKQSKNNSGSRQQSRTADQLEKAVDEKSGQKAAKAKTAQRSGSKPMDQLSAKPPEPVKEKMPAPEEEGKKGKKIPENLKFIWNIFLFFAMVFAGGTGWLLAYLLFCLIRKAFREIKLRYFLMFEFKKMIVFLYRNLLFVFKKLGLKSYRHMSPQEIGRFASERFGLSKDALDTLAEYFEKSRYSQHDIDKNNIKSCIKAYNELKIDIIKKHPLFDKIRLKLEFLSIKNRS